MSATMFDGTEFVLMGGAPVCVAGSKEADTRREWGVSCRCSDGARREGVGAVLGRNARCAYCCEQAGTEHHCMASHPGSPQGGFWSHRCR